jgi:hypothetical protein
MDEAGDRPTRGPATMRRHESARGREIVRGLEPSPIIERALYAAAGATLAERICLPPSDSGSVNAFQVA